MRRLFAVRGRSGWRRLPLQPAVRDFRRYGRGPALDDTGALDAAAFGDAAAEAASPAAPPGAGLEAGLLESEYTLLTVKELKALLIERALKHHGPHKELCKRLEMDDARLAIADTASQADDAQSVVVAAAAFKVGTAADEAEMAADEAEETSADEAEDNFQLGEAYRSGADGVEQDAARAVKMYRAAALGGHARAEFLLGVCYYKGEGVERDADVATTWIRRAADRGLAEAQTNVGRLCQRGAPGSRSAARSYVEAVEWFTLAAKQGEPNAVYNLGCCFENGLGVEADFDEALRLYKVAVERGCEDAQEAVDDLEKQMKSDLFKAEFPSTAALKQALDATLPPEVDGADDDDDDDDDEMDMDVDTPELPTQGLP
ncbi:hypothetical protein M885DRAFT_530461 [Pelagophyceae sp. CCMP2097]|nr:hypothetical protein M885DRAFT_530461 [Pelagophyceae sp. CCMP2097]